MATRIIRIATSKPSVVFGVPHPTDTIQRWLDRSYQSMLVFFPSSASIAFLTLPFLRWLLHSRKASLWLRSHLWSRLGLVVLVCQHDWVRFCSYFQFCLDFSILTLPFCWLHCVVSCLILSPRSGRLPTQSTIKSKAQTETFTPSTYRARDPKESLRFTPPFLLPPPPNPHHHTRNMFLHHFHR